MHGACSAAFILKQPDMKNKRYIKEPNIEDEKSLLEILEGNGKDEVKIRNRTFKFGFLTGFAQFKITKILLKSTNDSQDSCKCVAAAWLNGYFSLKFLWWLIWRWFYYIKQYNEEELTAALALIKKKVPARQYYANTMLLTAMRETIMTMNKTEVSLMLREQSGANGGNSAKNANG